MTQWRQAARPHGTGRSSAHVALLPPPRESQSPPWLRRPRPSSRRGTLPSQGPRQCPPPFPDSLLGKRPEVRPRGGKSPVPPSSPAEPPVSFGGGGRGGAAWAAACPLLALGCQHKQLGGPGEGPRQARGISQVGRLTPSVAARSLAPSQGGLSRPDTLCGRASLAGFSLHLPRPLPPHSPLSSSFALRAFLP